MIVSLVPLLLLFMAAACDLVSTMTPLEAPPRVSFINLSSSRLLLLPIAVNGWPHRNSTTCVFIKITLKINFSRVKFNCFKKRAINTESECYVSNTMKSGKKSRKKLRLEWDSNMSLVFLVLTVFYQLSIWKLLPL